MNLSIKKRLLLIVLIPLLGFLYYSFSSIFHKIIEKKEFDNINTYLHYSINASSYIHELQKERGMTSGYLGKNRSDFKEKLIQQRKFVDYEYKKVKRYLQNNNMSKEISYILNDEEKLKNIRRRVDNNEITFDESMVFFNIIIYTSLNSISNILLNSENYHFSKLLISYTTLIKAKENLGVNRALLSYSFNSEIFTVKHFSMYSTYKTLFQRNIKIFQTLSHGDIKIKSQNILNGQYMKDMIEIQEYINDKMLKNTIVSNMKALAGYGGLIHDFKNYLLRKDNENFIKFNENFIKLNALIDEYLIFKSTTKEVELLITIKKTFQLYKEHLYKLHNKLNKLDILQKDRYVKIDDNKAIKALDSLSSSLLGVNSDKWFDTASVVINEISDIEDILVKKILLEINTYNNTILVSLNISIVTTIILLILSLLLSYIYIKNILYRLKLIEAALVRFLDYVNNKQDKFKLITISEKDELSSIANVLNNSMEQTAIHISNEIKKNRKKDHDLLYEVEEKKRYLDTVIESNNSAIIAIDWSGKITTYNGKAEEIFMWSKEEMINTKNLLNIIPPRYKKDHEKACKKFLYSGVSAGIIDNTHDLEAIRKNGEIFPIRISFGGVFIPQKSIVVASIVDLTKEKAQEALGKKLELEVLKRTRELEIADKAKSDFLANMSYEIRTPLNGIIGFVDILYKNESDEKKRERLKIIKESSNSLLIIINDILDFSKLDKNKLLIEKIPLDINAIFTDVTELFFDKAKAKDVSIVLTFSKNLPKKILGDSTRIKQVLSNILSNAIKFSNEGSMVKINIKYIKEKNEIYCTVIDTGKGIETDKLDLIFKSFEQANNNITRVYGGTGLGLAISKSLITLIGGTIGVKSKLGKGSEFYFTIPIIAVTINEQENIYE